MFGVRAAGLPPGRLLGGSVCVRPRPVAPGPTRRVRDFPANGERLTAEEPTGVRHVLVNGTPIRRDEVQLDMVEQRPGQRSPKSPEERLLLR